jgi:hypothetical protein
MLHGFGRKGEREREREREREKSKEFKNPEENEGKM